MLPRLDAKARRFGEIDLMKATAIVMAVWAHSMRPFFAVDLELWESLAARTSVFVVPAFFFASGFLYWSAEAIPTQVVAQRLGRVLVPYLVVVPLAHLVAAEFQRKGAPPFLEGLLLGSTLGPYYFIYILTQFVVCTWFLSRLPVTVQWLVLAASAVALAALTLHWWPFAKPWETRTVARWGVWFLLGWFGRRHYAPLRELSERAPVPILCVALGVFAAGHAWAEIRGPGVVAGPLIAASSIVALFVAGIATGCGGGIVERLSDSTYTIYLYHVPLVVVLRVMLPAFDPVLQEMVLSSIALGLTYGLAQVAPLVLGWRARWLFGT